MWKDAIIHGRAASDRIDSHVSHSPKCRSEMWLPANKVSIWDATSIDHGTPSSVQQLGCDNLFFPSGAGSTSGQTAVAFAAASDSIIHGAKG